MAPLTETPALARKPLPVFRRNSMSDDLALAE